MELKQERPEVIQQFIEAAEKFGITPEAYYHLFVNHKHYTDEDGVESGSTVSMQEAIEAIQIDRKIKEQMRKAHGRGGIQ